MSEWCRQMLKWLIVPALAVAALACAPDPQDQASDDALAAKGPAELTTTVLREGAGREAAAGSRVSVHYTGWLYHPEREGFRGRKFDSSRDRQEPFDFVLGAGEVIPGWDRGVTGMKVGEQRTLVIPSSLAYGPRGIAGVIPADAVLVFDVELLAVE